MSVRPLRRAGALFLFLFITLLTAQNTKYPNSVTLSYEYVNSPSSKPQSLATVLYDPSTLKYTLSSWTPPSLSNLKSTTPQPTSPQLLRIIVPSGSSTLTALTTFNNTYSQTIDIWLSPSGDGSILSASVSAVPPPDPKVLKEAARAARRAAQSKKGKKMLQQQQEEAEANTSVQVTLIPPTVGPTPNLNTRKPPVVNADGQEVDPSDAPPEKTFLQQYWWVLLVVGVLAMSGGGGDK